VVGIDGDTEILTYIEGDSGADGWSSVADEKAHCSGQAVAGVQLRGRIPAARSGSPYHRRFQGNGE
jgi:hypothetical protein